MSKRIAVIGSRGFPASELVAAFIGSLPGDCVIISGGAKGVDTWAERAAEDRGLKTRVYRADWDRLGRKAGPIRNAEIIANCDDVVAFWDGRSRGTLNTLVQALQASRSVRVFDAKGNAVSVEAVMQAAEESGVIAAISRARG